MVDTADAMNTVLDLVEDLFTLVVQVLVEDVFFEVVWSNLFVGIFITLAGTWGFLLMIALFLFMFSRKYLEG